MDEDRAESLNDRFLYCGDAVCEECGDCLACYGNDPCCDGDSHVWPSGLNGWSARAKEYQSKIK